MALIPCPNCGRPVSDKAPQCPHCGAPLASDPNNFDHDPDSNHNNPRGPWIWIIIALIIIALIAVAAALYYKHTETQKREQERQRIEAEQHRRDSIAAEQARLEAEAAAAAEQARCDSLEWVNFTTPDLILLDLHGHVKSVSVSGDIYMTTLYSFSQSFNLDENGKITNLILSRNSNGQITSIKKKCEYMPDYYDQLTIKWTGETPSQLNGNGIDWASEQSLTYSNNRLISSYSDDYAECWHFMTTNSISPTECDEYGNWTKATVKTNVTQDGHECGEGIEKNTYSKTVRRTITYYPR